MASESKSQPTGGLGDLLALYRQLSLVSSTLFAPLARTYVGTLEPKSEHELPPAEVVNLALRKLAFEAGEMLQANNPPTESQVPVFAYNEQGRLPDLKLSYVAAAAIAYKKLQDKQLADQQAATAAKAAAAAPAPAAMATNLRTMRFLARTQAYALAPTAPPVTVRTTGGCGCGGTAGSGGCGCGGTSTPPSPPQAVPCYDPCAGGLVAVPPANESCVQPCSCPACQADPASTTCPAVLSISCDTKQRLRDCLKQLICDLLEYLETGLCKTGTPVPPETIICNFLHCVRLAICPPPAQPCLPPSSPMPCLPCSYAVENS